MSHYQIKSHGIKLLLSVITILLLSGCASVNQPLTSQDIHTRTQKVKMALKQLPLTEPLTLEMALARAIKYNLDVEIQRYSQLISNNDLSQVRLGLLPELSAYGTYAKRDKLNVGTDPDGDQKERNQIQASLSWNLLDFGLGYLSVQQAKNQVWIEQDNLRMVLNKMVAAVRLAYWQAQLYEKRFNQAKGLQQRFIEVENKLNQTSHLMLDDPLKILTFRKEIKILTKRLLEFEKSVKESKINLANLISLSNINFTLSPALPETLNLVFANLISSNTDSPKLDIASLEAYAQQHRYELRQNDYLQRISQLELDGAYWSLLPGLEIFNGYHYNDDDDLEHQEWNRWGSTITLDLLGYLQAPAEIEGHELNITQQQIKGLSSALMVNKQVRLAALNLPMLEKNYYMAKELASIDQEIYHLLESRQAFALLDEVEAHKAAINSLLANVDKDRSYLQAINGAHQLQQALGIEQLPLANFDLPLTELSQALKRYRYPKNIEEKLKDFKLQSDQFEDDSKPNN